MGKVYSRVSLNTATTGTGTITLGAAVTGFQTLASAGAVDQDIIPGYITDGTSWETSYGTYTASSMTITRILRQSSTGSLLNLSGAAIWTCAPTAEDHAQEHLWAAPITPQSGAVALGVTSLAGYEMLAIANAHGIQRLAMPHLSRMRYSLIQGAQANTFSWLGNNINANRYTVTTNYSTGAWSSTNAATRSQRCLLASVSTAGNYGAVYPSNFNSMNITMSTGSGLGGFLHISRFVIGDTVAGAIQFQGLWASSSGPIYSTQPETLTNCIGIGQSATTAFPTHLYLFFGGSSAQTPIDLGPNFLASVSNTYLYELILFSNANDATQVRWQVNRYSTSMVPDFTVTDTSTGSFMNNGTPGTTLPSSGTVLAAVAYRSNNNVASVVVLGVANLDTYSDS